MGVGESIKGTAKEKAGRLLDDDDLRAEGHAQHKRGEHEIEETKQRAKAKAHEEQAEGLQQRQEALEQD